MTAAELQQIFASNLKKYRLLIGRTQMELAEDANLSVGYLSDLEHGNKWGTPETIVKLSTALHVEPYQLFLPPENNDKLDSIHRELLDLSDNLKKSVDEAVSVLIKKYCG